MYNFRARARAVLPGSARAQGMGARVSLTVASQASQNTPTQALEILAQESDSEVIPETEMSDVELNAENETQTAEMQSRSEAATQPPHSASVAYLNFTLFSKL